MNAAGATPKRRNPEGDPKAHKAPSSSEYYYDIVQFYKIKIVRGAKRLLKTIPCKLTSRQREK